MTPEKLKQIEEIFHGALAVEPAGRADFLSQECGSDSELRKEVETLLGFDNITDQFFDHPPFASAADLIAGETETGHFVGRQFGQYEIIRLLGIGGMGEVYLAEDTKLGRKVALKILPTDLATDGDRMHRFLAEAKAVSALNHPNIITIHDVGDVDGTRFISTEFIDGRTLKEIVRDEGLDTVSTIDIAMQIASALEEAHAAGIIHRDIKPDNIMLRPNGLVKILDFGVAKLVGPQMPSISGVPVRPSGTLPGMVIGTADYMSPEQARGSAVDQRSDIFSFGIVLYEMLSGRKAFEGANAIDSIGAILLKEPAPLSDIGQVPASLRSIVEKCLRKGMDERFQNASEILAELRSAKKSLDSSMSGDDREADVKAPTATGDPHERGNKVANADLPSTINTSDLSSIKTSPNVLTRRRYVVASVLTIYLLIVAGTYLGYRTSTGERNIRSVAVMPFVNASGDPGLDYLSDGMTENLIRSLSSVPNMSVKARSTVFTYKGKEVTPRSVGSDLNVDAVLLGRLEQSGQELRLNLELVDTRSQDVVWTAVYARRLTDLVALQRDVARDVSARLSPELTAADKKQIAKNDSISSEAQQLYLKGRFHWNKRNTRGFERAIEYFEQAVSKDPNYALAYTGSADTYAMMALYGDYKPTEYIPKAKQAALKALELDNKLAEAHASLAYLANTYDYDWDAAEREYKTAIGLNPNYATARQWYAEHLAFRGRTAEALSEISVALELDPFSLVINRMKGNLLSYAGRNDEAIEQLNRTAELYPESPVVRFNLGEVLAAKQMYPEAIEQYLIGFKLDGRSDREIRRYQNAFKLKGWKGFWMEYLGELITLEKAVTEADKKAFLDNERVAYAYAATGNGDKAIEYLNKAFEAREPALITVRTSEVYNFLKYDPRYKEVMDKIGLSE